MLDGLDAQALLADRAFDTDEIVERAAQKAMKIVIPPKKNRKEQREYDSYLYKMRHLVENAFLHLKRWRGIASCYAKRSDSSLVQLSKSELKKLFQRFGTRSGHGSIFRHAAATDPNGPHNDALAFE